jgi:predicted nucleic acid-binding protein
VIGYVLDASVAAKRYLPPERETLVPEALHLIDEYGAGRMKLLVPDVFWVEIGNIFWKADRMGRMPRVGAEEAIHGMSQLDFPTLPSFPLLQDAFAIATRYQRSFYDSIYIALAATTRIPLLTADERLANALAAYFPVRWLGALI